MPSVKQYYSYGSNKRNNLSLELIKEYSVRKEGYSSALNYYNGKHNVKDVEDIIINLVKITCDRTVQFLFPKLPIFELDISTFNRTKEEEYIVNTFEANGGLAFLYRLATLGFLSGHNFMLVNSPETSLYKTYPRFNILDPLAVTIFWDESEPTRVVWYEVNNKETVTDFIKITDYFWYIVIWNKTTKERILEEEYVSPVPPLIEWQHYPNPLDGYGVSEFGQKVLQDKINNMANVLYKISLANAEPVDVILGADIDEIEKKEGNLLAVSSTTADIKRLEIKGNMAGIKEVLDRFIEVYLNVVRVVLLKGEPVDLQRVTNAAVRTLFLDSLAKREILMSTYNKGLTEVVKTILLMGYSQGYLDRNYADDNVDINFHVPLPVDLSEVANQNILALQGGYISKSTAAARLGLDWRYERNAIDEESSNIDSSVDT